MKYLIETHLLNEVWLDLCVGCCSHLSLWYGAPESAVLLRGCDRVWTAQAHRCQTLRCLETTPLNHSELAGSASMHNAPFVSLPT